MSMMMSCKQYLFVVTSGQLDEAGWLTRTQAGQHRMMCRRCRIFARNDAVLDQITSTWRERLLDPSFADPAVPSLTEHLEQGADGKGSGKL